MADVNSILAAIAAIQKTIPPPPDQTLRDAYARPPAGLSVFPVFLNLVESIPIGQSAGFVEDYLTIRIGMHLLMGTVELPDAYQQAIAWLKPTLETFNANPTLSGTADGFSWVEARLGEPLRWGERSYVQIVFFMDVFGVS